MLFRTEDQRRAVAAASVPLAARDSGLALITSLPASRPRQGPGPASRGSRALGHRKWMKFDGQDELVRAMMRRPLIEVYVLPSTVPP
jgi:hypothetical protein